MCVINKCCLIIDLARECRAIACLNMSYSIFLIRLFINALKFPNFDPSVTVEEVRVIYTLTAIALIFSILLFIFTILLAIGIGHGKRGLVKAYLIYNLIFQILEKILFILYFVRSVTTLYINVPMFVLNIIINLLGIYFLVVVWSYYRKMGTPANEAIAVYSNPNNK